QFLANVGRAIPGNYEAELVAEGLALLPLGPYKLAFTLTATVDGRQESYVFSALAGAGDSASGRQDTRVAMINRGDCTSRACQTGYVCDPDGPTCEPAV